MGSWVNGSHIGREVATIITNDGGAESSWDGKVKNLVYDVNTMAWIAQEPAGGAAAVEVIVSATNDSITIGDEAGNKLALDSVGATKTVPTSVLSTPSTATPSASTVSASATSVTILAANAGRLQAYMVNDSDNILRIKFGTTASPTSYTIRMPARSVYELEHPIYTGRIDGIWEGTPTGFAMITEMT